MTPADTTPDVPDAPDAHDTAGTARAAAPDAPAATPATGDDRLRASTGLARLTRRPELASLVGAVLIFALFMVVAPSFRSADAMATVLYASSTMGIMAVAVGLLMIGDEFDLSDRKSVV